MPRAAFFAFVGVAFFAYWVIADPSYDETATQSEWPYVLFFSGVILLLAFAVPAVARVAGGRLAQRVALVAASGATLSSAANIFEDGLQLEGVFFVFILGGAIMNLSLLVLAGVLLVTGAGRYRLLAIAPVGTVAGVVLFVAAGGPIMLATWLAAAMLALVLPGRGARPSCRRRSSPAPIRASPERARVAEKLAELCEEVRQVRSVDRPELVDETRNEAVEPGTPLPDGLRSLLRRADDRPATVGGVGSTARKATDFENVDVPAMRSHRSC